MSERHNSDGTAKSTTAKHALLLNRLVRMRGAPYYATAKDELSAATAGKVTIVKEKFYPADKELIEQLQAEIERYSIREGKLLRDNARLREALQSTVSTLQEYASSNPKHYYREVLQDPNGVHAALAIVNEALASTDSSNWLAEQKAQWRREFYALLDSLPTVCRDSKFMEEEYTRNMAESTKAETDSLQNPAGKY